MPDVLAGKYLKNALFISFGGTEWNGVDGRG
jgi:hypothetical protein